MDVGQRVEQLVGRFEGFACASGDDEDARIRKAQFALAMTVIIPAGVVWGLLYAGFGALLAAAAPLSYAALSGVNLAVLHRTRRFRAFQVKELALILSLIHI